MPSCVEHARYPGSSSSKIATEGSVTVSLNTARDLAAERTTYSIFAGIIRKQQNRRWFSSSAWQAGWTLCCNHRSDQIFPSPIKVNPETQFFSPGEKHGSCTCFCFLIFFRCFVILRNTRIVFPMPGRTLLLHRFDRIIKMRQSRTGIGISSDSLSAYSEITISNFSMAVS